MKTWLGMMLAGGLALAGCAHDNGGSKMTPGEQPTPMSQQGGTSDNNGGGSSMGGTGMGNMQGSSTGPTGSGGNNSVQQGSEESSPTHAPNMTPTPNP